MDTFTKWLAGILGQTEYQAQVLLRDRTATQFLLAWSILEAKCFDGFLRAEKLELQAVLLAEDTGYDVADLREAVEHFHARYQDAHLLSGLINSGQGPAWLASILSTPIEALSRKDQILLVLYVVFRYRNNMFHGNKGIDTWLAYRTQIKLCIRSMMSFISRAESQAPSLVERDAV